MSLIKLSSHCQEWTVTIPPSHYSTPLLIILLLFEPFMKENQTYERKYIVISRICPKVKQNYSKYFYIVPQSLSLCPPTSDS